MQHAIATDGVISLGYYQTRDALVLCDVDADSEHRRRFDFPEHFVPSVAHSEQVLAGWERDRLSGDRFAFAIRFVAAGELVGGCELLPRAAGTANVSYWTHPRHRCKGIASRAVALLPSVASRLGFGVLEILVDADNIASHRVAQKCGYAEQGTRDGRVLYVLRVEC